MPVKRLLFLLPLLAAPAQAADTLEQGLRRLASPLIKHCKDQGYTNVGVLKFLVTRDGKTFTDNAGTLNLFLARRLEVALVLANDPKKPIGIIDNASAVAHRTRGANHRTTAGRRHLFEASYPLAWGKEEGKADAFFTGTATVSPDLKTLTLQVLAIERKDGDPKPLLAEITVANQPARLVELGESFNTRGLFDDGLLEETPAGEKQRQELLLQAARQVHDNRTKHPLKDDKTPVNLEIRYDGRPVPIKVTGGKAFVLEPNQGQRVELVLHRDGSRQRYGAVLKVNGENTIQKERLPDLQCLRWILDPGAEPLVISGFQVDGKTAAQFRVLSVAESKGEEVNYGSDVGTITLTVFRELTGNPKPPPISVESQEAEAVARVPLPAGVEAGEQKRPKKFQALKAQFLDSAQRGLVVEGLRVANQVERVPFTPDPVPVMSLTIVYYHPQDLPK